MGDFFLELKGAEVEEQWDKDLSWSSLWDSVSMVFRRVGLSPILLGSCQKAY